ncbi:WD repeat protein [Aspergillus undulatus]|uniref:WD repeat protein n=1 Tax=Aspergillus undulatus TaxID=1810928 RepID=UPI003CCD59AA
MGRDHFSRYSSPALLGSDDPSMIKESEDLLSKFMRGPSQEALDTLQQAPNRRSSSSGSTAKLPSAKPRVKIPRGNVQLRPQSNFLQQAGPPTASLDRGIKAQQTVMLPVTGAKPPSPQTRPVSQSPTHNHDQPSMIRRSGRSKAEPINYYKKLSIFDSESDEEVQVVHARPIPNGLPRRQHQHSTTLPSAHRAAPATGNTRQRKQRNASVSNLLHQREVGGRVNTQLSAKTTSNMKLTKAWKGASNDIVSLAWSPDGSRFAAGATAQCDEHMMAYNRKNNLLFGDLVSNQLHELPDHWIQRPNDRSVVNDPRLFMSVTAVQWFENTLYTASYDHTVKLWDTSKGKASCYKTLKHDSKVIVMARSNFAENLLATGTRTIGYWDTRLAQYTALELPRTRSRKHTELVPTSVAWGTNPATKEYLLAGMSEKEDGVAQHGLLAAFRYQESTVTSEHFSPNSQNVFDVAWHPGLPIFATACTAGQQASRGIRSVVNLYEPLKLKSRVMEFECPALDMNQTVFCPFNTSYISASCTDGAIYVWDLRNSAEILHTLKHGEPVNQLDETISRELADTGVNMHLWGYSYDQFYTGASDGVIKRWNILRAPEDALVEDVASLKEGIMCGAFSPDRSNLLVGDVSGGMHLLSTSSLSDDDTERSFRFRESPYVIKEEDPESGVRAARDLISSGQIERHPFYGPGQGPRYRGPFAAWARPSGVPPEQLAATPLTNEYQRRQLIGLSPKFRDFSPDRQEEVMTLEKHITLAVMRNQRRGVNKRRNLEPRVKTEPKDEIHEVVDLCSDESSPKRRQPKRGDVIINSEIDIIDLTGNSDTETDPVSFVASPKGVSDAEFEDGLEDFEEDFWWPESRTIDPNFSDEVG